MALAIYALLLVVVASQEWLRSKKTFLELAFLVHFFFLLTYVVCPMILICFPDIVSSSDIIAGNFKNEISTPLIVLLSYFFLRLGWVTAGNLSFLLPHKEISFPPEKTRFLSLLGIVFSGGALYLYAQAFGGILKALILGSALRYSADVQNSIEIGSSATFGYFVSVASLVSYYCYIQAFLVKPFSHRIENCLFLVFGFFIFLVYSLIVSSRGGIATFILMFLLIEMAHQRRFVWGKALVACFLVLLLTVFGKQLFSAAPFVLTDPQMAVERFTSISETRLTGRNPLLGALGKESAHAILAIEQGFPRVGKDVEYTYFSQFIFAPLYLVPRKMLGFMFEIPPPINAICSDMLGVPGGGIPPGLIGSFLLSGGVGGVSLGMLVFGFIGGVFQNSVFRWSQVYPGSLAVTIPLSFFFAGFIGNGDPKVFLVGEISFILVAVILLFFANFSGIRQLPKLRGPGKGVKNCAE